MASHRSADTSARNARMTFAVTVMYLSMTSCTVVLAAAGDNLIIVTVAPERLVLTALPRTKRTITCSKPSIYRSTREIMPRY